MNITWHQSCVCISLSLFLRMRREEERSLVRLRSDGRYTEGEDATNIFDMQLCTEESYESAT